MENFFHQPVLLKEVLQYLNPKPNQNFIDGTIGGGGHAEAILEKTAPSGILLGMDLDQKALKFCEQRLKKYKNRVILVKENYKNIKKIKNVYSGLHSISGILLDLGLSSFELKDIERGFSFQKEEAPLDMRFDKEDRSIKPAADILNTYSKTELIKLFKEYGEEDKARPIAHEIIFIRKKNKIRVVRDLLLPILRIYKRSFTTRIHPATKIFQALRIAVNDELNNLNKFLPQTIDVLRTEGRVAVISYHSLEDRLVKNFFKNQSRPTTEDPVYGQISGKARLKIITKKVIKPSLGEIKNNPRSRSAKLRVAEKI